MANEDTSAAKPAWLEVGLAEYNALRAEVVATMQSQMSTLTFGSATLGILAAGAFNIWKDDPITAVVFLVALPLIAVLVLVIWLGELQRMMRAGDHLAGLEHSLQAAVRGTPDTVMIFERWLRCRDNTSARWMFVTHHVAVVVVFTIVALASVALGWDRANKLTPREQTSFPLPEAWVGEVAAAIAGLVLLGGLLAAFQVKRACLGRVTWREIYRGDLPEARIHRLPAPADQPADGAGAPA